jgi:hypothetical protein
LSSQTCIARETAEPSGSNSSQRISACSLEAMAARPAVPRTAPRTSRWEWGGSCRLHPY